MKQIHPTAIISPHARFHTDRLVIGEHTRIDDGAVITGDVEIGGYCHIAVGAVLTGRSGIKIGDYTGISMYVVLLTGSDDFSGRSMVGPTVPGKYKPHLKMGAITVGKSVIVGAHSTVMPGVKIGDGVGVGAYSLVNGDCEPDSIYGGTPAKLIKKRSKEVWDLVAMFEIERALESV